MMYHPYANDMQNSLLGHLRPGFLENGPTPYSVPASCAKGYQSTTKRLTRSGYANSVAITLRYLQTGAAGNNSLAAILSIVFFSPHSKNGPFDDILGFFLACGKVLLQLALLE
jgi:hypothetical protein